MKNSIHGDKVHGFAPARWTRAARPLWLALACLALLAAVPCGPAAGADSPLSPGAELPALKFQRPADKAQSAYLGLPAGKGRFTLGQVGRPLVLLELFNMYCHFCQAEAPKVNRLQKMLAAGPLKDRLALVGVGMGNSPFEVKVFRERYQVKFPLLPDTDYVAHNALGKPRTPTFVLLGIRPGKRPLILLTHVGPLPPLEEFKDQLLRENAKWRQEK